jgi:hypothetical protein
VTLVEPVAEKAKPKASRKATSKGAAVLTAGAGGTGGGAIALLAQSFPEPYRTWISVIAPTFAAGFTAWWPRLVEYWQRRAEQQAPGNERRSIIREMDRYISKQQSRLRKDKTLSPSLRSEIEGRIAAAQTARAKIEFSIVTAHIDAPGDVEDVREPDPAAGTPTTPPHSPAPP